MLILQSLPSVTRDLDSARVQLRGHRIARSGPSRLGFSAAIDLDDGAGPIGRLGVLLKLPMTDHDDL